MKAVRALLGRRKSHEGPRHTVARKLPPITCESFSREDRAQTAPSPSSKRAVTADAMRGAEQQQVAMLQASAIESHRTRLGKAKRRGQSLKLKRPSTSPAGAGLRAAPSGFGRQVVRADGLGCTAASASSISPERALPTAWDQRIAPPADAYSPDRRTSSVRITRKERAAMQARQEKAAFQLSEAARRKQWKHVAKSAEEVQRAKRAAARKELLKSLPVSGNRRVKEQRGLLQKFRPSCMPNWGKTAVEVKAELAEQKRKDEKRARKKDRRAKRERAKRGATDEEGEGADEEVEGGEGGTGAGSGGAGAGLCGDEDAEMVERGSVSGSAHAGADGAVDADTDVRLSVGTEQRADDAAALAYSGASW